MKQTRPTATGPELGIGHYWSRGPLLWSSGPWIGSSARVKPVVLVNVNFLEIFMADRLKCHFLTVMPKIGCAAANHQLLCGKPLCYGTIGLLNKNIHLRSKINVILAKGSIIVASR